MNQNFTLSNNKLLEFNKIMKDYSHKRKSSLIKWIRDFSIIKYKLNH
jgi:hypothetical protein